MLTNEQVAQFQRDGFLKGGRVLDDAEVDVLRDELKRVIDNHDTLEQKPVLLRNLGREAEKPIWQIINIWQSSEPFAVLMRHPKIGEEIAQLTDSTELRIWHDQIQYKPAETGGVNMWHQDAPLWPNIAPMTQVSAWVALDDVDEENGCMSMVPGSHLWGNHHQYISAVKDFNSLPEEFEGHEVRVVTCPVKKGEVHYHHSLTWHGSRQNTSGRPRRAIAYHYMPDETRYVADGMHVMRHYAEMEDGEPMRGSYFPLTYSR